MNNVDRGKIARIRSALTGVPYAHDGSKTMTASVAGFVAFQKDMRVVKTACEEAMFLLTSPDPDKTPVEQALEFESAIKVAEDWIAKRKAANWRSFT